MKNALITGAGRGLGKIIAENLLKQGCKIICLDILEQENIEDLYLKQIDYFKVDLSIKANTNSVIDSVLINYDSIDIFIHNASIRYFNYFENYTINDIENYYNINLISAQIILLKIIPFMKENSFGRIIFISSMSGLHGYSTGSLYCSTKGAMIPFIESLSKEFKKCNNLTANLICPDSFITNDGIKFKNYSKIISAIISNINKIIVSKKNGKIIRITTFYKIIINLTLYLKAIFKN